MIPRARGPRLATAALALLGLALAPGLLQLPALAAGDEPSEALSTPPAGGTLGDPVEGLRDLDLRGTATPLAGQGDAVAALGDVQVRWNRLGTPASLLPADGSLGAAPGDPVAGARTWLRDHAAVFGLTTVQIDDLALVNNQKLAGSTARAVLFRQEFDALVPASGSLVTVGVADGQVAYVSSSLTRATGTPPAASLTPLQGWLRAAANVGRTVPAAEVGDIASSVSDGWTRLSVPGFAQEQQVRLRALALADGSVRPVLEANVLDTEAGAAFAYTVLVDAVTGEVLVRRNQVDNHEYTDVFTGSLTSASCGPRHTFELTDDLTKQINAVALALPVDDVVVKFYGPGGTLLATQDLLTSPEVATYSADSIPPGVYGVEICPFDDVSIVVGQYSVLVSTSNSEAPGGGGVGFEPRWRYFTANPTPDSAEETPTNAVVGCWNLPQDGCDTPPGELRNVAAPGPWDALTGGLPTQTTIGNNATTHEAWGSPLTPGGLFQAPVSPTREYTTEFTDAWNNTTCDPTNLAPGGNDIDASVTNLFAAHNRMHDYSYYLGFTEQNYNLQADNGGRGGVAGDPEVGNAQAGAVTGGSPSYLGRDNANQITLQDGVPGITNQYLFQPIAGAFYAPCTDGGLDMGIVGHEYTHAISNRMVGGPDDGLSSEQGGAMGESWSDLVAGEYLFSHDYTDNPWAVGAYATGNEDVAIRDYAIDRNPLNFSDYGFDSTGVEVHADGEIWNGTMWEVRQALVDKYDAQFPYADKALQLKCAQATESATPLPVELCPGNRRWVQLVFDSFLLQQGATSMLDARDAMLAADTMRFGGADLPEMWAAFARRGMGKDATTPDADSGEPTPSFASAIGANTAVTFHTTGAARIYVGDYEARVTPVADTIGSTELGATAGFTPGTYRLVAVSPDHGFQRFTMTVTPGGGSKVVQVADQEVNLAGAAAGAAVLGATEGSLNPESLIDGTEETNWGGVTEANVDESTPSVAVDLAGGVHTVRRVHVSAMLTPAPPDPNELPLAADPDSGSRFTALRQFALEACVADCGAPSATWTRFYTSAPDAFPSQAPRPVAPTLTMRSFDVPATQAAAVRLVVVHNQCTGNPAYAGELDNDPANATDCKTDSDRGTIVHASELQVFSKPAPPSGTVPTTPGQGTGPKKTKLTVKLSRKTQTGETKPPRLTMRLRGAPAGARDLGRLTVRVDGEKVTTFPLRKRAVSRQLTTDLDPGRHRIRVVFRPADPAAYTPAKSRVVVVRVLRS